MLKSVSEVKLSPTGGVICLSAAFRSNPMVFGLVCDPTLSSLMAVGPPHVLQSVPKIQDLFILLLQALTYINIFTPGVNNFVIVVAGPATPITLPVAS